MAIKKYLRRKRKRSAEGNGQQHFFKADTGQYEAGETNSFFPPSADKIQTKLKLSQPGDSQEVEADRMAEKVTNSKAHESLTVQRASQKDDEKLSRVAKEEEVHKKEEEEKVGKKEKPEEEKVSKKGKEEEIQKKTDDEKEKEKGLIATKSKQQNTQPAVVNSSVASKISTTKGAGSYMSAGVVNEMSGHFGYDFSSVRIHTNNESEKLNNRLQAQAFTHGSDIYFNSGKYNPETVAGKKLLAHELTHVVQQKKNELPQVQRQQVAGISTPVPKNFGIIKKLKQVMYATGKINGITVIILPDARGPVTAGRSGETKFGMSWKSPRMIHVKGVVTKVMGNPAVSFSIITTYKEGIDTTAASGYGKGTSSADKAAGDTSLLFHEGSHGTSAMDYLQNNPLPKFTGIAGMTATEYSAAEAAYDQAMNAYYSGLQKANVQDIDCTGKPASFCAP